ncbi:MAG: hypothetical protein ACK4I8_05205 [Armatimonadota bacterium]
MAFPCAVPAHLTKLSEGGSPVTWMGRGTRGVGRGMKFGRLANGQVGKSGIDSC